jgi:hypothetical protein
MTDPTRLLASSFDEDVQRLLKAGVDWKPAAPEQERIWQAIASEASALAVGLAAANVAREVTEVAPVAGKVSALGMSATTGAVSAAASSTKLTLGITAIKAIGVGLGLGTALLVGGSVVKSRWVENHSAIATAAAPTVARPVSQSNAQPRLVYGQPGSAEAARVDKPSTRVSLAAAVSSQELGPSVAGASQAPGPSADHDAVREESRFVSMARGALRQGRAAEALQLLGELDQLYPSGLLGEERMVLRIDALVQSGSSSEALELAARFLARYPSSLSANHVRELIGAKRAQ